MPIRPGQRIRFLYTQGEPDVFAWDLGKPFNPALLNKSRYVGLLAKAGASVLLPFGIAPELLIAWSGSGALQLSLSEA